MALVGYARVSTEDQATARQLNELRAAGCRAVAEEHASGGDRDRPVLARTLARLRPGDTFVVVSLDRLARSVRGEGPIPAETFMDAIRANTDRSALNGPTRALLDGVVVYETKKITGKRAKALFGL